VKISTITAGFLGMQVVAVRDEATGELLPASSTIEVEFGPTARDAITPVWPPTGGPIEWPPKLTMKHDDVHTWTEMWGKPDGK
jgi:hypothetical protein